MNDLFTQSSPTPLAARMRPERLADVVGQDALKTNGLIKRRLAAHRLGSVVLYGPPGTGKTTIARALGAETRKTFVELHPSVANVADIRRVAQEARAASTLLFIDEVHRLAVNQLEVLLRFAEEGTFDLVSATTENPYHCLSKGFLSRSQIVKLDPLDPEHLIEIAIRAIRFVERETGATIAASPDALAMIAARSGGDARRAINAIDDMTLDASQKGDLTLTAKDVEDVFAASALPFDRRGDEHYDIISAFIKSIRGSDPQSTLYWLARLINGGEDPRFIARRLMIHASEDIGLADNSALATAVAAMQAVEYVGYPECSIILAHAALHIALAPKSGSACAGIHAAMAWAASNPLIPVPPYLKDAHYAGAAKLGHSEYVSPHDDPRGWNEQVYAPGISPGQFYRPQARTERSYEARAARHLDALQRMPKSKNTAQPTADAPQTRHDARRPAAAQTH